MRRNPDIFEKEGDLTLEDVLDDDDVEYSFMTPSEKCKEL